jgi:surfactin synthase thioesterase subunit
MQAVLLHHAGGDQYAYRNVRQWLLPEYESIAVELPGRSDRIREPLIHNMEQATNDIFSQLQPYLTNDYFFIGMSMGGLFAWLLSLKFQKENLPLPKHIFFVSRMPIEYYAAKPNVKGKSSDDFWNMILDYGGCPPQLVEHKELREFYEPILRADFEMMQDHAYGFKGIERLDVPASVYYGKNDHANFDAGTMSEWNKYFKKEIEYKAFEGDHFFFYNDRAATDHIKLQLKKYSC